MSAKRTKSSTNSMDDFLDLIFRVPKEAFRKMLSTSGLTVSESRRLWFAFKEQKK